MKNRIFLLFTIIIILLISLITGCARKPQLQTPIGSEVNYPQKIAILLPLHGPLAKNSQTILNGFLVAYYNYLQHDPLNVSVHIIDTSKGNVKDLYKQAVDNGAIFIIGPLTKRNVRSIAQMRPSVPTLSLNTITNLEVNDLYQFGLSTQDEVAQIVSRGWEKHPGNALIIAPLTKWGQNIAQSIETLWKSDGGTIIQSVNYRNLRDVRFKIKRALNVDLSQENARHLENILGEKLKFNPRSRKDINLIFLIALPNQGRQIRPLLNYYFAGNIPIYSTSLIYSGVPKPNLDRDLDGIIFCGMPWTLQRIWTLPSVLQVMHKHITHFWPNSYNNYNRFYALGIDSYYLMLKLNTLIQSPSRGISGATGTLYLNKYNHIYRQLEWAQMRNGKPYVLSKY